MVDIRAFLYEKDRLWHIKNGEYERKPLNHDKISICHNCFNFHMYIHGNLRKHSLNDCEKCLKYHNKPKCSKDIEKLSKPWKFSDYYEN